MAKIEISYEGATTEILCQLNEKLEISLKKFFTKLGKKEGSIFFIHNGNKLDEELTFEEAANTLDKINNRMKILGFDYTSDEDKEKILKKSKNIICPICMENAHISVEDFIISLYDCKNNHRTDNIQLNEFEKTQYVDQSKIICDKCKEKNKSESIDNKFYICFPCKMNLCILCKKEHDKNHKIFNYDDKDFYCKIHSEAYSGYCNDCKSDICNSCQNDHRQHYVIQYGQIIPDIESSKKQLKVLNIRIKNLKTDIKNIIKKLNHLNYNLDNYYEIYNNMVTNFDIEKKNYSSLKNINDMQKYNDTFMRITTEIINDTNIKTKFSELSDLLNKMSIKEEKKEENKINKEEKNIIEDNNNNIERYNPSDDKYENFQLSRVKELKSFEIKYNISDLLILHDRRLLTNQYYHDEKNNIYHKIIIYDLNNGIICDINYDIDYSVKKIFQMNDDNLIIFYLDIIKIFEVKRKTIEEIYSFNIQMDFYNNVFNFFGDKFIITDFDYSTNKGICAFLSYENKKINKQNQYENKKYDFIEACGINENEIVLLCKHKEKLFGGDKAYLLFYDIKNYKDIKALKLGNFEYGNHILLLNDDNLIVELNKKFILINTKSRVKKGEYDTGIRRFSDKILRLNNNSFILVVLGKIFEFKADNSGINFVGKNELMYVKGISKYPDNQLITTVDNRIYIYGQ